MEKWSENLTDEQEKLMQVLGGFLADIPILFEVVTKDMEKSQADMSKIAYVQALLHELNIVDFETFLEQMKKNV